MPMRRRVGWRGCGVVSRVAPLRRSCGCSGRCRKRGRTQGAGGKGPNDGRRVSDAITWAMGEKEPPRRSLQLPGCWWSSSRSGAPDDVAARAANGSLVPKTSTVAAFSSMSAIGTSDASVRAPQHASSSSLTSSAKAAGIDWGTSVGDSAVLANMETKGAVGISGETTAVRPAEDEEKFPESARGESCNGSASTVVTSWALATVVVRSAEGRPSRFPTQSSPVDALRAFAWKS